MRRNDATIPGVGYAPPRNVALDETSGGASLFTVVGRPGPYEASAVEALAERGIHAAHRVGDDVALRTLETRDVGSRPVVFLHGRGHAAVIWAPILAAIAPSRSVVALDLPGFGRSGAPPTDGRGITYFSDPIEAVLQTFDRPIVVGHSLGGYVALTIALGRRVDLGGLVLVDAMGIADQLPLRAHLYLRAGPERVARLRGMLRGRHRPEEPVRWAGDDARDAVHLAHLREEILRSPGTRERAQTAFEIALGTNVRTRLDEIRVPTRLVWGTEDETFPLPHAIDAASRIPGADLVRVDAGHSPHVARPATVASAIHAFLSRAR